MHVLRWGISHPVAHGPGPHLIWIRGSWATGCDARTTSAPAGQDPTGIPRQQDPGPTSLATLAVMGDGHPNASAYRRTADAFRANDLTAVASLVAEDVVWHVPGSHSMAGDIRGRDDLLTWLGELTQRGFRLRELEVFGNDRHVCAISVMGAQRDGVDVSTRVVSVFTYDDGKQTERWLYPDDIDAWAAIFDG